MFPSSATQRSRCDLEVLQASWLPPLTRTFSFQVGLLMRFCWRKESHGWETFSLHCPWSIPCFLSWQRHISPSPSEISFIFFLLIKANLKKKEHTEKIPSTQIHKPQDLPLPERNQRSHPPWSPVTRYPRSQLMGQEKRTY